MSALEGDTIVSRRWVGIGLALYGALSLVLILILLVLVIAPRDGEDGLLGLDAQRRQLLGVIDASGRAIENAETAARGVDDTLLSTGGAAASAAVLMNQLATTMRELAASLRISILGSQPFAGPADQFDLVAAQAGRVAADLDLAAVSIRLGAADMVALADKLAALRTEVTLMRGRLDRPFDEGPWRLVASAILGWLLVPALVSLWVGLRWSRRGAPRGRGGGAG
ncbi:MAG: hypothetical protein WEF51_03170 [Chloroflexota bacterium]